MSKSPFQLWYKGGLRFKCTGCGGCCTGEPGYVWLTEEDIERLSSHLKLPRDIFLKKYTRYVNGQYSLLEKGKQNDCIFLKENRCTVYDARPKQCRKFPWWKENLASKEAWDEAARSCEGINHKEAPLIPAETIQKELET